MAQLHDHVKNVSRIAPYDTAGYCAITWMDYAGYWVTSDNSRNGFDWPRQWPAEDHGATDPSLLTNIDFYIPGAEELGVVSSIDGVTDHIHSTFLTEFIEGDGCATCGNGGVPLAPISQVAADHLYSSTQDMIDLINSLGGVAILNHPSIGESNVETNNWMGIAIINTFMALRDERAYLGVTDRLTQAIGDWDDALENRSAYIWGIANNDNFGPYLTTPFNDPETNSQIPVPTTAQHLDQGKIEVLVTSKTLSVFEAAFRRGAFFAIREDETQATKGAYPVVTGVSVTTSQIALTTSAGDETVTWIGNGSTVGTGFTLSLFNLSSDLKYVRAEIDDGAGRTLYTQPFAVQVASPRAVGGLGSLLSAVIGFFSEG